VRRLVSLSLAALGLIATPARADTLLGTRTEGISESSHLASIVVYPTHATIDVTRTVHNAGDKSDQAAWLVDLPPGGVATSLRTLGTLRGEAHWWAADLFEAEAAARLYRELTGFGPFAPKDPALLAWRRAGQLSLQVFPVASDQDKVVGYSIVVPAEWRDGLARVTLSPMGIAGAPSKAKIKAGRAGDVVMVNGERVTESDDVPLDAGVTIELRRSAMATVEGLLAVVPADKRALVRFDLDAAPRLSTVPASAFVVIVLDVSRSMKTELPAAVAAARAYLAHMPDARVEIVTFGRRGDRLLGGFASVDTAREALLAAGSRRTNGSHVDAALAEADALLAGTPPGSPRRVIVLTDARLRAKLDEAKVRASLGKSGALVHVGIPHLGSPSLRIGSNAILDDATRATGGLVWNAAASDERPDAGAMASVYEEWARPKRLDDVSVTIDGGADTASLNGSLLEEGQSLHAEWIADKAPRTVVVQGRFWAEPFRRVISPDDAYGRVWSALIFGNWLHSELSPREMMAVARRGGAVSPVTSYLAIEPGVRPSTEGLEGHGRLGGSHRTKAPQVRMGATSVADRFDAVGFLREKLRDGLRTCGGGVGAGTVVHIETTTDEIVDVSVKAQPAELATCLDDVAWGIELPPAFREWRNRFDVDL
jgi:Mg-chelatase subunit ChlD